MVLPTVYPARLDLRFMQKNECRGLVRGKQEKSMVLVVAGAFRGTCGWDLPELTV
jgi:hypothetical protein